MAYNNIVEDISSFDYNDEIWHAGTSSSSSDIHSSDESNNQSEAMVRWADSYQNIVPFDYEAWQFEGTLPEADMTYREERFSAPLSVWEASAQSMGNSIPHTEQQVLRSPRVNLQPSPSLSHAQSPANSPPGSVTKSPYSRKRLSESALNRRRSQNRESQRSFRERQKLHVVWLEDQLRGLKSNYNELEKEHVNLNCKYRALLESTGVSDESYPSAEGTGSWSSTPGLDSSTEHNYDPS